MLRIKIFHTTRDRSADVKVNEFLEETAMHHPRTVIMGITHQTTFNSCSSLGGPNVIDSVLVVYNTREDEEEETPMPRPIAPDPSSKPTFFK